MWNCPFCLQRNQLPPQYNQITPEYRPAELILSTMEYKLPRTPGSASTFFFVIDLCLEQEELSAMKTSIMMTLSHLPENSTVGLITFGRTVQLYELGFDLLPKSFVFNGKKETEMKDIIKFLGLTPPPKGININTPNQQANKFLCNYSQCDVHLESIIEELQPDPTPVLVDTERPLRSTGAALSVAVSLLEACGISSGRLLLFLGGPCTFGPGTVVSQELKMAIRSHHDITQDNVPYLSKASKFYQGLADRISKRSFSVDFMSASLDQMGILEMVSLLKKTAGIVVMEDTFKHKNFIESVAKVFSKNEKEELEMGFDSTIEVQTSAHIKIRGFIAHGISMDNKKKYESQISEETLGVGGTTAWKSCVIDPSYTISVFFEIVNMHQNSIPTGSPVVIQFRTHYSNSQGQKFLRVTSVQKNWVDTTQDPNRALSIISKGFDQEASAVLISRMALFKCEDLGESTIDVIRWIDKLLIKLVTKFSRYVKDQPSSFTLSDDFTLFPTFMFHLRRGSLLQIFNSSPDETAIYRYVMSRENLSNGLLIIQPTLESYSLKGEGCEPVNLSATSLKEDVILLLDNFFQVIIWHGKKIAKWREEKYQEKPNYKKFAQLLEAPLVDAEEICKLRFPIPTYIICDQDSSPARHVTSAVDPTFTYSSHLDSATTGQKINTEDVNLGVFMEHLKKIVVSN